MGWQAVPSKDTCVSTPGGELDLALDTRRALARAVRLAWLAWLARQDNKVSAAGCLEFAQSHDVLVEEHARLLESPVPDLGTSHSIRAALGAPMDARLKARFSRRPEADF
eukprot:14050789-Alexandrium_andersonii.AAC.1